MLHTKIWITSSRRMVSRGAHNSILCSLRRGKLSLDVTDWSINCICGMNKLCYALFRPRKCKKFPESMSWQNIRDNLKLAHEAANGVECHSRILCWQENHPASTDWHITGHKAVLGQHLGKDEGFVCGQHLHLLIGQATQVIHWSTTRPQHR